MSSYDGWLPPLISHEPHQAHTIIDLVKCKPEENHRTWPQVPELEVVLEASIYYVSKNEEHDNVNFLSNNEEQDDDFMLGLFIYERWNTLCKAEIAIEDILKRFSYLESEEGQITWNETLHNGKESSSVLSSPEAMADKFSRYLSRMMKSGFSRYEVKLRIDKEIVIPKEELKSWHSWYDAKKKSDPMFEKNFTNAISRSRTREELFNETVKPRGGLSLSSVDFDRFEASETEKLSAECCIFCMDEFLIEFKASKLYACSHIFHRDCLEKWLKESKECPVCRSQVRQSTPSTDDNRGTNEAIRLIEDSKYPRLFS